ncbi:MAG: bifunctional acetate--CoA ligase family protein/GNAT family N-acetyltransferase [Alphaproteobacteria bacterium]|nr:bifunctional acetate--CoA ligase family protein/GNAT family N-acetyltransferase [Alphaproteobacteria bacterium]
MTVRSLECMFNPSAIALVGASKTPGSIGWVLARNLMSGGFDGPIMPVNPKHRAIGGALAWPNVAALPVVPDLAVICTPPDVVPGVIAELRDKGCKAAVVITAGFGEGGDRAGAERAEALRRAAGDMRILGPNVLGLMVPGVGLNAGFAHKAPLRGDLAFVAQSGAVLASVLDWASTRDVGFSHMVALGDMLDIDFGDMLDYLGRAPEVRAILLYIEAIKDAREFMSAARAAARMKPVVVVKGGRRPEGAQAASSHTGALAGSDAVYDAAFRRAGMLRVIAMSELFDAVETLSRAPRFRGPRMAILTNGGGMGVMATDALIDEGGQLAELSPDTIAQLDALLPKTWSRGNPVDIIGDAPPERYAESLRLLLADPGADAVLVLNTPTAVADSTAAARVVAEQLTNKHPPVLTCWLGTSSASPARKTFFDRGIPSYNTPDEAVRAFMHMVRYDVNQKLLMQVPPSVPQEFEPDTAAVRALLDEALDAGRNWLTEPAAKAVLKAYGVPVGAFAAAEDAEAAAAAASGITGPFVVKIVSPDIIHKSDVGGVMLDLNTPEAVGEAAAAILERARAAAPEADIDGVIVEQMVRRPGSHELIVGISEDAQFGPVVLFGQGGTAVEEIGDTAMALPPLNSLLARSLIERTRIYRLLRGYREQPPADLAAIELTLMQVAQFAADFAEIIELDINPLLADSKGVLALDARIRVGRAEGPAQARLAIRPYPKDLESAVFLRDGSEIFVRPIRPEDAPALQEMVSRASPEDLRLRFFQPIRRLPEQLAARLTQIDYDREMAFISFDPAEPEAIIAVARLMADPDVHTAEYAIIVRTDWKGRGLGYALMNRLLNYAAERRIATIYGEVLRENENMLNMARDLGFSAKPDPDDPSIIEVRRQV